MSTLSFPSNPSLNDTYTFGGKTWVYNGSAWDLQTQGAINGIVIGNVTPAAGTFTTISAANGIPTTTVANTAPANPEQGDIWIDSDTGTQLIYFTASGNSQWAEMEADQSFSVTGSDVDLTAVDTDILPTANITYDIGNTTNRFRDIYLANSTIYLGEASISATDGAIVLPANSTVGGAVLVASPIITAIDYPGDDTAADPAGGQTISIEGANFQSGAAVYVDGGLVGVVSFISSSVLQFVSPAKAAGSYSLYVVNPNGATAIAVPGIQYSGTPTWSTAAGSIGTPYETTAFATTVVATGDVPITYALAAGNSLPTDMALTSANGYLAVASVPVTNNDTTYNFNIVATDAEQQDTPRQFSVTYKVDVVTWDSPANAASYVWDVGVANSVAMSASSAAGKAISFAVQSGSLPSNVSISGNLITGTPDAAQANTSVIVRATAATTNRFADRTFYFTTQASGWDISSPSLAQSKNSGVSISSFGSISFSTDGTKLFTVGAPTIYTYDLGTAYDLNTISAAVRTYSATAQTTSVVFSTDGTKMYTTDYSADIVRQYNLSSAYNTDTVTSTADYNVGGYQGVPFQVVFSADGTKMFVSGNNSRAITRFDLATPWSVTTASYVSAYYITNVGPSGNMRKVYFKTDGTAMFVTCENSDQSQGQVRKYTLNTAWDISSPTLETTFATWTGAGGFFPGKCGLWFNSLGTIMILGSDEAPLLAKYTL